MKGLYLISYKPLLDKGSGIGTKIRNQIDLFNSEKLPCSFYFQKTGLENSNKIIKFLSSINPWSNTNPKWEIDDQIEEADFIYFRKPYCISYGFVKFLKKIRIINPTIKIYMEIPTYPYDSEYVGILNKRFLLKDIVFRKKIEELIDCIFVIDPMKKANHLYGNPTIRFINGYNVSNCKISQYVENNSIDLLCVAMFQPWHGYERIIEGLYNYYKKGGKRLFKIHFVGDGPEKNKYILLTQKLNLSDYVIFYGILEGKMLEEVYNVADYGVSSLGRYKSKIYTIGDLKSREYISKGLPIIIGCKNDNSHDPSISDFILEFDNSNEPIDFNRIVKFDEYMKKRRKTFAVEKYLHEYAKSNYDIRITMKPVLDKMKSDLFNN